MSSAEPAILPEPLGARMKRARRSAGFSIEFMAERFHVSVPAVRSWEQNLHKPHDLFGVLEEWARLTNVSYTWLLTGGGEIVTEYDSEYHGPVVVDERQGRLKLNPYPPSRIDPELSLVV